MTMHSRACAVARPYAAGSNRRYDCVPPGGDGYAGEKISACCVVYPYFVYLHGLFLAHFSATNSYMISTKASADYSEKQNDPNTILF